MNKQQIILKHLLQRYEEESAKIQVNPLGSCQYNSAWELSELILELHSLGGHELVKNTLSISYDETKLPTLEEVKAEVIAIMDNGFIGDTDEENEGAKQRYAAEINEQSEIEHVMLKYLHETKSNAWDLWSAHFPPILVEEVEESEIEQVIKDTASGPIFNIMSQDENFQVGVSIALWQIFFDFSPSLWGDYDT